MLCEGNELRQSLGDISDMEALARLIDVNGMNLTDIGCGDGLLTRQLAEMGATVLGVEPDPVQAEKNRREQVSDKVRLVEAGAEALPAESGSIDGVTFFRSLHHVPAHLMDTALREAARVLKQTGFLYVVEPGMDGSHFRMMRPFHDETQVRNLAQQALARTAVALFEECSEFVYMMYPRYADFDSMADFHAARSFNTISREMVDVPEVRREFEAGKTKDGYVFEQPMLVNFYRRVRSVQG